MVSQTERITAVSVVVSQLNDLAAAFNEQHRALDRAAFRDLCRQLHEPLNAILKLGIADKSIEQAIRKSFGYDNFTWPTPGTQGGITIDLAMVFLSDDPKADSVLELVGYNKLHDRVEVYQDGDRLVLEKEVLKPGRIAESSLGPVMPTYYRHDDGSLSDLTPRMYAKFCKAIIEVLKLPLSENTLPGGEETTRSTDAIPERKSTQKKILHTPVADPELEDLFIAFCGKYWDVRLTTSEQTTLWEYLSQPRASSGRRRPKELVKDKNSGANGVQKVTRLTSSDAVHKLKKRVKKWFQENIRTNLDFETFMQKFGAWLDS